VDRVVVNSVYTRAFFMTTNSIRSRVHFFGSAGTTAGHYPVGCELTVFGKGIERRSVRLDGGRLNQPDGIRLEDAFPSLPSETSGICGLEVRLDCPQGRINLLNSRIVLEMVSPQFSLSFMAAPCSADAVDGEVAERNATQKITRRIPVGIAMHDRLCSPSLVIVNGGADLVRPDVRHVLRDTEAPLHLGTVAAESVVEFPLDEALCKQGQVHEALWGDAVIEKLWAAESIEDGATTWYLLYRDPVHKRPVSVCAV
jgi:hypothetical protein